VALIAGAAVVRIRRKKGNKLKYLLYQMVIFTAIRYIYIKGKAKK